MGGIKQEKSGSQFLLYDADQVPNVDAFSFDPQEWLRRDAVSGDAKGRGTTLFVRFEGEDLVLRHYHRGGLIGPLLGDRYLWTGLERTRAWCEWRLLARMYGSGLPVPRPLIARVVRHGLFYRADLVTARIEGARTLAQYLLAHTPGPRFWRAVGALIQRFHLQGVYHADLNAHNVLVDPRGRFYLIDFDRGRIRRPRLGWQNANLYRFRRSLEKLAGLYPGLHYSHAEWQATLEGYGRPWL